MQSITKTIFLILLFLLLTTNAFAAAAEGQSPWDAWMLFWRVVNTIALIALLVYVLRKPLVKFFSERKSQIQKDLQEAREQKENAERLLAEYQHKLAGMERELEKMRAELKKSAEAETSKVVVNAEKLANSILESARIAAEQEVRKAKIALKNEAVELAVSMAESLIREKINEDDRKKIVEDYLLKVGGMKQ